ncbi:TetR family transcriptional regulator, partial [Escherichia coli]|nr:TetR family transcriptional regulator [Escherichia coli]
MQSLQTDRGRAPRRSQQERREETRAALLDATIEALVEGGYATLTLAQVTERAGLSLGA